MAYDLIVRFREGERPTLDDIEKALSRYLGEPNPGTVVWREPTATEGDDIVFVTMPGTPQGPFADHPLPNCGRGFEIALYAEHGYLEAILRMQDEFTHAVVRGFAEACARYWGDGTVEEQA